MTPITRCLDTWIADAVDRDAAAWLDTACAGAADAPLRRWVTDVALVPRRLGRAPLAPDPAAADAARPGWDPAGLRADQAGRLRLILACPPEQIPARIEQIAATADTDELATLYRGLPLYPHGERLRARAQEGCRSNISDLFCAVAHRNPYPSEQFAQDAWNQMILKAVFIGVALDPIVGLDRRCDPTLAAMLTDYAAERRAAGRPVRGDLWRCVAPYADDAAIAMLRDTLAHGDPAARDAAALALHTAAPDALDDPARARAIAAGDLDWHRLGGDRKDGGPPSPAQGL